MRAFGVPARSVRSALWKALVKEGLLSAPQAVSCLGRSIHVNPRGRRPRGGGDAAPEWHFGQRPEVGREGGELMQAEMRHLMRGIPWYGVCTRGGREEGVEEWGGGGGHVGVAHRI